MEWFWLKGILEIISFQLHRHRQAHLPLGRNAPLPFRPLGCSPGHRAFLGCEGSWLAHVQPHINHHPHALFCILNPSPAQPVSVLGIALNQVYFALSLAELLQVCTFSPLHPVHVPLDGILSLQSVTSPHSLVLLAIMLRVN